MARMQQYPEFISIFARYEDQKIYICRPVHVFNNMRFGAELEPELAGRNRLYGRNRRLSSVLGTNRKERNRAFLIICSCKWFKYVLKE